MISIISNGNALWKVLSKGFLQETKPFKGRTWVVHVLTCAFFSVGKYYWILVQYLISENTKWNKFHNYVCMWSLWKSFRWLSTQSLNGKLQKIIWNQVCSLVNSSSQYFPISIIKSHYEASGVMTTLLQVGVVKWADCNSTSVKANLIYLCQTSKICNC